MRQFDETTGCTAMYRRSGQLSFLQNGDGHKAILMFASCGI
jgi:hypothetical protein